VSRGPYRGFDVDDIATQALGANYVRITNGRGERTVFPGRLYNPGWLPPADRRRSRLPNRVILHHF